MPIDSFSIDELRQVAESGATMQIRAKAQERLQKLGLS